MHADFTQLVKDIYHEDFVALHRPVFDHREKASLSECIDSNFVSSVGKEVMMFEKAVADFCGVKYAAAIMNGTSALHLALRVAGVNAHDEVLTQALSFVATANSISYCGASPVFVDVDLDTFGMSPRSLREWLLMNTELRDGQCRNKHTGAVVKACVPMHTFGIPCRINEIRTTCDQYGITLVEDAAESLGSYVNDQHTGVIGELASISFNGNKIITTGGGGMILTNNVKHYERIKHLSTTAKVPHQFEFIHDEVGFNYRMPNLNACLGLSQMQKLSQFLKIKKSLNEVYSLFFGKYDIRVLQPIENSKSNYWLNTVVLPTEKSRDEFLNYTNANNVMTRPVWRPLNKLKMYETCQCDDLTNTNYLEERAVNVPSSVPHMNWRIASG